MGSCLSKKNTTSNVSAPVPIPKPPEKIKPVAVVSQLESKNKSQEEGAAVVKKEIFIIKHRKSHEVERQRSEEEKCCESKKAQETVENVKNAGANGNGNGIVVVGGGAPVRTSSCTKEEVDAILIQCGRLSRSSSTGKPALSTERKYSGSKRSYDFDNESGGRSDNVVEGGNDDAVARERENRRRERHRHHSQVRRRTPSRERDLASGQQRSGSRERGSSGGRRGSRSPGRRSESPVPTSGANSNSSASAGAGNGGARPGKMVSVPATVSSLALDKNAAGEANTTAGGVKRIQVKRNVGGDGTRAGTSPRARSPARLRAANENQAQPISLSRSNSRKAEHSPHRRNPLGDIDSNIILSQKQPNADTRISQGAENKINTTNNYKTQGQHPNAAETKVALNVISAGPETLKHHPVVRSRSSRLSRELDINPESLLNPNSSSYTALLLEDIQNFHQKNTPPPALTLPACVTNACSILEAVADLNSSTGSNLSTTVCKITEKPSLAANTVGKPRQETREPFVESEIVANDDLMEPSFHKYVTVTRGTSGGNELEEQESSGSNSYAGSSQQQWVSSSCWEPTSAESTDRWASSSSRSGSRQNNMSPVGFQRHDSGRGIDEGGKRLAVKKRDLDHHQQNGNGQGRIGSRGGPHMATTVSTQI